MKYRKFGKHDLTTSEIGYGAWAIGGSWGAQNDGDSLAALNRALDLGVNQDIKSRVTYSVITKRLNPEAMGDFVLRELDRVGLGHNTSTPPAIDLLVHSADGVLRKARNLGVGCPASG